jgi:hypothetical protein
MRLAILLLLGAALPAMAQLDPERRLANARAFARNAAECQQPQANADTTTLSLVAGASESLDLTPAYFCLRLRSGLLAVTTEGPGVRLSDSRRFAIPVSKDESIESIVYGVRRGRLYLVYQVTVGTSGNGFLAAFDTATLRPIWPKPVRLSINAGPVLFHDRHIYVSGFDMVGMLDERSGSVRWSHVLFAADNVPQWPRGNFNSFRKPLVRADVVIFPEASPGIDTIVVRVGDGAILAPTFLRYSKSICASNPVWC